MTTVSNAPETRSDVDDVATSLAEVAILFEPDGYVLDGPKLMGRQAAGNGFLRAAVAGRGDAALWAYTPNRKSAQTFAKLVGDIDPTAKAHWLPAHRLDLLSQIGGLYLPDPRLAHAAQLRLRAGPDAYSICGVTHTAASHTAMDAVAGLLSAPVMPWDALICTSQAARSTIETVLQAEWQYLRWRFGAPKQPALPQLPVIPLGVHCADFEFSDPERAAARAALGIADDAVVALFVGRLSFHSKAHPHAMYRALQTAAERSGKPITLLQCGRFWTEFIERAFKTGAVDFCPGISALFIDGTDAEAYRRSWAAADLFISLSDNIQETFGLTPIEAMAAGLPAVVTDWNGYKDTVRDGEDGFRIATWMAPAGVGEGLAHAHESSMENYDFYCGLTCQLVSVDHRQLADRLTELVANPQLRRRLGAAGRRRARELFDWSVIYRRYQALWAELATVRKSARKDSERRSYVATAPKVAASRLDPCLSFAHYPTAQIRPETELVLAPDASIESYAILADHVLYSYAKKVLPPRAVAHAIIAALSERSMTIIELVDAVKANKTLVIRAASVMAKMGLVSLRTYPEQD